MLPHQVTTDEDFEAILANELTALSLNDRNKVQEEIHCVKSLAVEETPAMVDDALKKLQHEATRLIAGGGGGGGKAHADALIMCSPYVQSRDFGLKLLRADFFNVKRAARRMVNHLELLLKFFGPVALQRPLRYSDLNKEEQDCIRKGPLQILPSRDKAGRLILVVQGSTDNATHCQRVRILLYFFTILSEDVETQKHGVVIIFAAKEECAGYVTIEHFDDLVKIHKNFPFRLAVSHQCLPDGPAFQFMKAGWLLMLASKDERVRTKFHGDLSLLETQYDLLTYGIPVHQIPRTHTGNIKVKNHLQWLKTRKAIDQFRESSSDVTTLACSIIGHPGRNDVLFSRGGNAGHPGNVEFQLDVRKRLDVFISNPDRDSRPKIRDEVVRCVKARNGRFLHLPKGGWWEELAPDKVLEKITTSFYDCYRRVGVKDIHQSAMSDTYIFLPSNKRQKVGNESMKCGLIF